VPCGFVATVLVSSFGGALGVCSYCTSFEFWKCLGGFVATVLVSSFGGSWSKFHNCAFH
jgi:hypothetical protein